MIRNLAPFTLLFAGALTSCLSTPVVVQKAPAAQAEAKQAAPTDDEAALRKKSRAVEYAKLQLEIARMDAENEERSVAKAVEAAERELAAAKSESEHFKKTAGPLELDERTLSVDRAKQNVVEAQQELEELETMYSQEDFAQTTKELVLTRGRARLAMSKRDLDLAERRAAALKDFEHKKRDKELGDRVTKAQSGLDDAKARAAKSEIERRLALMKAEHALDDAQRELAQAQKKDESAQKPDA